MLTVGCDIGALTTKAAAIRDGVLLKCEVVPSRPRAVQSATDVMDKLLSGLGIQYRDIDYCISTGYGRNLVPFANGNMSEISCHGRGAQWLVPSVRTVIDGGGQDCKAIRVDGQGRLIDFRMNTKCAAGTGKALELMAKSLGVDVSELGPLSLQSKDPVIMNKPCCILTQIEVKRLIFEGRNRADIAAGANDVVAREIMHLVRDVGQENDIAVTGGVAKNAGLVKCLERHLGVVTVRLEVDPQFVGAIGAAVLAADACRQAAGRLSSDGSPP
ncbi:MAG: acyl-CoA dehydratase activase [Dehalococcoidia bacterium]|nr:acyl-CoA dehydratase activase [Dehalococcoidia bacterium]